MGHMLPGSINVVRVISNVNGQSFEQYGIRETRGGLTGYYNGSGKYIPIFSGDEIFIPRQGELRNIEGLKNNTVIELQKDTLEKRGAEESSTIDKYISTIDSLEKIDR
jgi:hypothetical protein